MANEVAKREEAVLPADLLSEMAGDVKLGGAVSAADLSLPFLRVLQGLSPQLNRDNPAYLKGATAGDIALTVLDRYWERDDGVIVVFCHYTRVFVEWRPPEMGGGLINVYKAEDPIVGSAQRGDKGTLLLENGNSLVETAYHAVLVEVDGKWVQAVMPLKSTMLKISKKLNNVLTSLEVSDGKGNFLQAPRWYMKFKMTTTNETRMGNTWAVPSFEKAGPVDADTYRQAKAWAIAANKSSNFAQADAAQTPKKSETDDELPF